MDTKTKPTDNKQGNQIINSKMVDLYNASSDVEADSILSLLALNGIEAYKKPVGAGSYLSIFQGFNTQGIKLVVLDVDKDQALELLQRRDKGDFQLDDGIDDLRIGSEADDLYKEEEQFVEKRRFGIKLLFLILIGIPMLMYLIERLSVN